MLSQGKALLLLLTPFLVIFATQRNMFNLSLLSSNAEVEADSLSAIPSKSNHATIALNDASFLTVQNDNDTKSIVHIIRSRFMVDQGNLTTLGQARFELMKQFTFASLQQQTSQNFIWLILTDPQLDESLKHPLLELVQPHNNMVVLATNQLHSKLFDKPCHNASCLGEEVWMHEETLQQALDAKDFQKNTLFLDTWLDADDALYANFVDDLHTVAQRELIRPDDLVGYCPRQHLEWHFLPHNKSSSTTNITQYGKLESVRSNYCITAGLTAMFSTNVRPDTTDFNLRRHSALIDRKGKAGLFPLCNVTEDYYLRSNNPKKCIMEIQSLSSPQQPIALRSRCPTSTAMGRVVQDYSEALKVIEEQSSLWNLAQSQFGVNSTKISRTRSYLQKVLLQIAKENLQGQCLSGKACYEKGEKRLKKLLEQLEKQQQQD